jgi:hypothetical protein
MQSREPLQYVQFKPGAYLFDTDFHMMTAEERGVYWSLIIYLYVNGGTLDLAEQESGSLITPNGRQVAVLSNCFKTGTEWEQIWNTVRKKFKIKKGILTHTQVTKDLRKAAKYRRDKSLAGKKGMESRYGTVRGGDTTNKSKAKQSKDKVSKDNNTNPIPNEGDNNIQPNTNPKDARLDLDKSPQQVLDLDLQIAEGKKVFIQEATEALKPRGKELITLANITRHLVLACQTRRLAASIFQDAAGWARECAEAKAEGRIRNAKAVFVAKVKEETGFKKGDRIL